MSNQGLAQVMDRFTNDPTFREHMRNDPETAIRESGIQLSDMELTAVRDVDWNESGEALQNRVSKIIAVLIGL